MRSRWLVALVAAAFLLGGTDAMAQKRGSSSGSSRPSGGSSRPSGGGSSRPSGGTGSGSSRMFGGGSKPSGGTTTKPSGGSMFGGSKPSTGAGSTLLGGSSKPSTGSSSGSSSDQNKSGTMFGGKATTTTQKPPAPPVVQGNNTSSKPVTSSPGTAKAQAQRREESKQRYVTTQKATAPPKTEAVVNGRTVKVDTSAPQVTELRSKPSTYIQPTVRRQRVVEHVTVYHYAHPADYYYGRPVSYGIGPFSNGFWWMMMEWDAQRRAEWLYHNQARISAEAYADAMRDAEVQRRLAALEAQKVARNVNYVDPEFRDNPTDAYDQNYVEAVYNPPVMPVSYTSSGGGPSAAGVGKFFLWTLGIGCVVALGAYLVFGVRWGK